MLFCVKNFPVLTINKLSVHKYSRLSIFWSYFFQALMFWKIDKICYFYRSWLKIFMYLVHFSFPLFFRVFILHVVIWQDILICNQFGRLNLNYCINLQIVFFSKSPFFCFCFSLSLYFLFYYFIFTWLTSLFSTDLWQFWYFPKLFIRIYRNGYINVYSRLFIFGFFFPLWGRFFLVSNKLKCHAYTWTKCANILKIMQLVTCIY